MTTEHVLEFAKYIVESRITSMIPDEDVVPFLGEKRFARLRPEFGFVVVVWTPSAPDLVQEVYWNTEEERRHTPYVGRIVHRPATEREKRDGERQHEEAAA